MKTILVVIVGVLMFVAGAGATYFMIDKGLLGGSETKNHEPEKEDAVLVPLAPFIVNLSAPERYLKTTIEFELYDNSHIEEVEAKEALIRDAIITLLSSKSLEGVSAAEGKHQLKDEILYRGNLALGGDIVKNIYFTEFVMQ